MKNIGKKFQRHCSICGDDIRFFRRRCKDCIALDKLSFQSVKADVKAYKAIAEQNKRAVSKMQEGA